MKLAELYYRRQDFANAQTHFEIIAQQNPNDPLAEKALFFAAESAMMSSTLAESGRLTVLEIAPLRNGCAAAIIFKCAR